MPVMGLTHHRTHSCAYLSGDLWYIVMEQDLKQLETACKKYLGQPKYVKLAHTI